MEFILSTTRRVLAGELYDSIYCETFCSHNSFLTQSHSPKGPESLFGGPAAHSRLEKIALTSGVPHCRLIYQTHSQQLMSVRSAVHGSRTVCCSFLSFPKSFKRPWCKQGGTEWVIKNDKSLIQENIHLAAGTVCPCQKPPCGESLNTWQTFPLNLCNLRRENFKQKVFCQTHLSAPFKDCPEKCSWS